MEAKFNAAAPVADLGEKMALLRNAAVYRPCLTLLGLIFFQQFCCIYPFTSYTVRCLPSLGNLGRVYEKQVFLASGAARLLVTAATSAALAAFNQKQLLLLSATCMSFSSALVLFVRLTPPLLDASALEWISLTGFLFYLLGGSVGLLGVPWTIIFELLPTEVKGLLGPVLVAVGYATMSLVLKLFPTVYDAYTTYVFAYTTLISLCALLYVSRFVVETKGKSLYEIENFYAAKCQKETKLKLKNKIYNAYRTCFRLSLRCNPQLPHHTRYSLTFRDQWPVGKWTSSE